MSWKSPIDVVYNDLETSFEDGVFKAIQRVQINVDKDELIKALQYDRDQYEKGYDDGKIDAENKIIRCKNCKWYKTEDCIACNSCQVNTTQMDENDYCSRAERKEE